jgi:hypothetical protein
LSQQEPNELNKRTGSPVLPAIWTTGVSVRHDTRATRNKQSILASGGIPTERSTPTRTMSQEIRILVRGSILQRQQRQLTIDNELDKDKTDSATKAIGTNETKSEEPTVSV